MRDVKKGKRMRDFSHNPQDGRTYTADDIRNIIKEQNIQFIKLQFVDINGQVKNLSVPAGHIDKVLENEIMLDGSSIKGFRDIETSDMFFFPDVNTFQILPWQERDGRKSARLICDIYNADGTPFEGCPRCNLKRIMSEAEKLGFSMNLGPEAEFFLFNRDKDGNITSQTMDKAGYYDVGPDDEGEHVRSDIVSCLQEMGFDIEASHHEGADGQHEIDFRYSDILTAADNIVTFKTVVKAIATQHNLHATFMPKPIYGINGSGMHCNISLFKDGKNAFYDETAEFQLSDVAKYSVGGILKHIKGITAVLNPTVNSYKRLVPGFEAPVYIAWSLANRSALVRVPAKRGNATRVELRSPDPSCNPYLAFATILEACLDGIRNKIDPPAPVEANIYKLSEKERKKQKIDSLPGSLKAALINLDKSIIANAALGQHIMNEFVTAKDIEWDEFRTYVSQWEIDKYLARY